MFDNIELKNCPDKFALNCKRYEIKCHECKANGKGKYLLYLPIDKSIIEHPVKNEPKKKTTSYSRKGKTLEQKTITNSDVLIRTAASGSYVGDGDAYIALGNLGRVRVEHKTRFNNKNLYNPTSTELKEGLTQNIKVWYIRNNKSTDLKVFVNYNLLMCIITAIFLNKYFKIVKSGPTSYTLYNKSSESFLELFDVEYKYIEIKRGLGLKKDKQSFINLYKYIIAKTSYGTYCYMSSYLFEKLVKNYIELK